MTKKPPKSNPKLEAAFQFVHHDERGLERLIFFSDAVFAIAITLLALEIRLPATEETLTDVQLLQALGAIGSKYLGYVISFLVVGLFWMGHHRKFRLIERYDRNLLLLNLFLLMVIGFVPFPTSVLSEYGNRTATIFYALTMTLVGLLSAAIWWYASHHNRLVNPQLDRRQIRRELLRTLAVTGVFILSIGVALIDTNLARLSWLLTAVVSRLIGV